MAEILQMYTVLRRLYPPDLIPFPQLVGPTNLQKFQDCYKFSQMIRPEGDAGNAVLIANGGEFSKDGHAQSIQQLIVQPNVLQLQISGDTAVAEAAASSFIDFFREIGAHGRVDLQEYATTIQTIAIARLSFTPGALFSPALLSFLKEDALPNFRLSDATPEIGLGSLSWRITYNKEGTDFMYLPKALTIEPRAGSRESDRIYYTVSPSQSSVHLQLLKDLEQTLMASASAP